MSKGVHVLGGREELENSSSSSLILDVGLDPNGQIKDRSGNSTLSFIRSVTKDNVGGVDCINIHEGAIMVDRPHKIREAWLTGNLKFESRFYIKNPYGSPFLFGSCKGRDTNAPFSILYYAGKLSLVYSTNWNAMFTLSNNLQLDTWHTLEIIIESFYVYATLDGSLLNGSGILNSYNNHGSIREYDVLIGEQTGVDGNPAGHKFGYIEYLRIHKK